MKVEILLKIPHKGKKTHKKSARCQDRTDDLRIMGPTRSRLRQPRLDIIVSLRNTWGANFYRFAWQKKNLSQKKLWASVETMTVVEPLVAQLVERSTVEYSVIERSLVRFRPRGFFSFSCSRLFSSNRWLPKNKERWELQQSYPSGYGGGLEIHWALPAQVQVLPTAIHFLFTNFRAFSSFLCSFWTILIRENKSEWRLYPR